MTVLIIGCSSIPPEQRAAGAKTLFEQAVTQHQQRQFAAAATGYERLLKAYRDQPYWCAQALRSLGNVRAAQGRTDEAVRLYRQVSEKYPQYEWEVLQAWKSAGDLLWEAGHQDAAQTFYRQIVTRFDRPDAPAIYKMIVRGAKARLSASS